MGFGECAAHIILFIAVVIVASSMSVMMATTVQKISIGMQQQGTNVEKLLKTDFKIINDPDKIPTKTIGGNTAYVFYIKNIGTGSFPISNRTLTVIIDGTIIPQSNVTATPSSLNPSQTGEIDVVTNLSSGNHVIRIILYNGVSDSLEFTV